MDTSKVFVNMCQEAKEIQALRSSYLIGDVEDLIENKFNTNDRNT